MYPDIYFQKKGIFQLENSSEVEELVGIFGSYPLVGETWNLTIYVNENSTSGVRITAPQIGYFYHEEWWEGNKNFTVIPNKNHTEIYISHVQTDFPTFPIFFINLLFIEGYASGSYILTKIQSGYNIPSVMETLVGNITAWLEEYFTSTITSSTITMTYPILALVGIGILLKKKKQ